MTEGRFFVVGGVILVLTGALMLIVRPRRPEERGLLRIVNRGTIWAGVCVLFGALAVLVGLGAVVAR